MWINPNAPEGLADPDLKLAQAETWMLVSPQCLEALLVVVALVTFAVWLAVLLRKRDREGGWAILACAIPLLVVAYVVFLTNFLHLLLLMVEHTPYREIYAEQLHLIVRRFFILTFLGFAWGFAALWTGLWLILLPPKKTDIPSCHDGGTPHAV